MFRYIVRRLLQMILTFFGATFVVFALMFANQDDPIQALAGEKPVSDNVRAVLTERYHLDESFPVQYWYYMKGLLTGDLGRSMAGRDIGEMLSGAWPVTLKLSALAIVVAALIAITAGVWSAIRRGGFFDNSTLLMTLLLLAVPIVVLAPVAQLVFAMELRWFPATTTARAGLYDLLLPAVVLACSVMATQLRVTRTSVVENLRADYVRTARAKGLTPRRVTWVHVLRNSLIPVITLIGVDLGMLMSGAIIVEEVFNIPGVGFNLARGIRAEDGPLVVGFVSVLVVVFLVVNLVVDLLYAALDPRIRYE
ncbi:ABC transporter permease [Actinoplanes couchii]|uniref:Dipeptide-transport integral membrane protein ABC transporter DppB n=1 Tax=Actinoplanes couchii TaxID=403638 RepID=A0ABQ3XC37_9ACTN|nr:ABC transporter permease [Actinoplanes couchii]MDR6323514.1 oligopeptide transport system permease protein [Actinoplanes couchii]GID56030.1 putative dipeptide-transport integral membrane protein ABC transporter DppB [Actinoplanes couchii]